MNVIDLFFVIIIILLGIRGLIRGLVKEIFGLGAIIFGILFAHLYYQTLGYYLSTYLKMSYSAANVFSFFIIFFAVYLIILVAGTVISGVLKTISLGFLDRIFGFLFGALKAVLFIVLLDLVAENVLFLKPLSSALNRDSIVYHSINQYANENHIIDRAYKKIKNNGGKIL